MNINSNLPQPDHFDVKGFQKDLASIHGSFLSQIYDNFKHNRNKGFLRLEFSGDHNSSRTVYFLNSHLEQQFEDLFHPILSFDQLTLDVKTLALKSLQEAFQDYTNLIIAEKSTAGKLHAVASSKLTKKINDGEVNLKGLENELGKIAELSDQDYQELRQAFELTIENEIQLQSLLDTKKDSSNDFLRDKDDSKRDPATHLIHHHVRKTPSERVFSGQTELAVRSLIGKVDSMALKKQIEKERENRRRQKEHEEKDQENAQGKRQHYLKQDNLQQDIDYQANQKKKKNQES